jgi:polysaccharide export outer membrane protein
MVRQGAKGWARRLILGVCCLVAMASYGTTQPRTISQTKELPPPSPEPPEYVYRLSPGDSISIKLFYYPDLTVPVMVIPPDGKISLPLVSFVQAAGLTPEELQQELHERFSEKLALQADVSVSVVQTKGQQVFVGGEIARPQLQPYESGLTLYSAILRAGGERKSAKMDSVLIIRMEATEKRKVYRVDMTEVINGEIKDVYLEPYDVVILPTKFIFKVNYYVRNYIDGVIPQHVYAAFGFSYPLKGISSDVTVYAPQADGGG